MVRIILGVIVGFVVWTVLWLGSDQVLINLSKGWYGAHQFDLEAAMLNETAFTPDRTILLMHLVRAILVCLFAGFVAAWVSTTNSRLARTVLAFVSIGLLIGTQFLLIAYGVPAFGLLIFLALAVGVSFGSRFVVGEDGQAPFALGILLLLFGLMVQIMAWNYLPIWYHAVFILLLIPMTVIGGRLKSSV